MANIVSVNRDVLLDLSLNNIDQNIHKGWIGYELNIYEIKNKHRDLNPIFSLPDTELLCLDASVCPEIPELCDGLMSVVNEEVSYYLFEPIDERDFKLKLEQFQNSLLLSIYSHRVMIGDITWDNYSLLGIEMKVEKGEIIKFIDTLLDEYAKLKVTRK